LLPKQSQKRQKRKKNNKIRKGMIPADWFTRRFNWISGYKRGFTEAIALRCVQIWLFDLGLCFGIALKILLGRLFSGVYID
jgi:hypothetical protein